jgi:hypothetical protein
MIENGSATEQAAVPTAPTGRAELTTNQAVWLPLVVMGTDGKPMEVKVRAILGKIYSKNPNLCTVSIKDVDLNTLSKAGRARATSGTPRASRKRARAQPESSAQGAAPAEVEQVPPEVPLEVPLEAQRPPKKQKPSAPERQRAIVRILVLEDPSTASALLNNLTPLERADLFVAAKSGAMDHTIRELPNGSFTQVAFVTKTTKKQKLERADLRGIHALVANIRGVAPSDLLCAIAFDSETVADEAFMSWPNVVLLDTETVAKHGLPAEMKTLVASPEYAKLAGRVTPPVRTPTKPAEVVQSKPSFEVVDLCSDDDE